MDTKQKLRLAVASLAARPFDWDGVGGLPIRPDVAAWAWDILFTDFSGVGLSADALGRLTVADVTLNGDGTVELAFDREGEGLVLTVECGGVLSYVKRFGNGQATVEGVVRVDPSEFDAEGLGEIDDLLNWLAGE